MFTQKITKSLWENCIHTMQDGRIIVGIDHIYGAKAILLLFCDHQDTNYE